MSSQEGQRKFSTCLLLDSIRLTTAIVSKTMASTLGEKFGHLSNGLDPIPTQMGTEALKDADCERPASGSRLQDLAETFLHIISSQDQIGEVLQSPSELMVWPNIKSEQKPKVGSLLQPRKMLGRLHRRGLLAES